MKSCLSGRMSLVVVLAVAGAHLLAFGKLGQLQAASVTYQAAVLADNPVAYWRLSEPAGTTMFDFSGNGHNGTYTNGPGLGAQGYGVGSDFAVDFDGTNDYAVVPDHPDYDFLDYTLEAIIKLENPTAEHNRIISQQSGVNFWLLHVRRDGLAGSPYRLTSYSSLDGVAGIMKGPDLNDGEFHHVAITRDTVNDVLTWYVDGVNVGTETTTSNVANSIAASVYVSSFNGSTGPAGQIFPGIIDEVALYNTALGADEIAAHFAAINLVPEPGSLSLLLVTLPLVARRRRNRRKMITRR